MKMYTEIIGNMITDPVWADKLSDATIDYLDLDQWTAQKSRFIARNNEGTPYGIALKRHCRIENGDILEYDAPRHKAVAIRIALKPVMIIDLQKMAGKNPEETIRHSIELGHAIGNQHWPAIVKGTKVFVPLTVDPKVMLSVMDTHHFADISYTFQPGQEIIPYLAPHEIRQLFGGCAQGTPHLHTHEHLPNGSHAPGHTGPDTSNSVHPLPDRPTPRHN